MQDQGRHGLVRAAAVVAAVVVVALWNIQNPSPAQAARLPSSVASEELRVRQVALAMAAHFVAALAQFAGRHRLRPLHNPARAMRSRRRQPLQDGLLRQHLHSAAYGRPRALDAIAVCRLALVLLAKMLPLPPTAATSAAAQVAEAAAPDAKHRASYRAGQELLVTEPARAPAPAHRRLV